MFVKRSIFNSFIIVVLLGITRVILNLTYDMRRIHFFRKLIRRIEATTDNFDSIIDIACGIGHFSEAVLKEKPGIGKIASVDINDRKRWKDERNTFFIGKADNLPLDNGSFDISFIAFGLHHMENPLAALLEARRITKCYVIILEDMWSNPVQRLSYRLHIERANRRYNTFASLPVWTEKQWKELFEKADFTVIVSKPIIQIGYYISRRMYILKPNASR